MKSFADKTFVIAVALAMILDVLPNPASAATRQRVTLAFVANQSADNISAYTIKPNGQLVAVTGSPFSAESSPNSVAVVPSGRFAYVADVIPGGVSGYSVSQNGVLTPVPGSPFATPAGTAFVTIDPSGRFLYALNCGADCSGSGPGDIAAYN
ncbi:MAG: beta-propeller fold lactonase family protein, partial [Terriglobales bacterium]